MSELKSFDSQRIYWACEQVERVAGDVDNLHLDDNQFYIKSEADEVIRHNKYKQELESLRAKLPKWHRCDEPDEDGFFDLPPESGSYFAQYETTWADGVTKRYCEPLEYDADACDWPQLTNHCRVIRWCERPEPPED